MEDLAPDYLTPLEPKPPSPRMVLESSSSLQEIASYFAITSWAIRSPGWMTKGAWPRFKRMTLTSPRKAGSIVPGELGIVIECLKARPERGRIWAS